MSLRVAFDLDTNSFDIVLDEDTQSFEVDDGLQTEVAIALFEDARATNEELERYGFARDDNRGTPMDSFPEVPGDRRGSKLWLLMRALRNDDALADAVTFAEEALAYLVQDGVAKSVSASAEWIDDTPFMELTTELVRPDGTTWIAVWNVTTGALTRSEG